MFEPQHAGLFFSQPNIDAARQARDRAPLNAAWDYLLSAEPELPLARLQLDGLRWRFDSDTERGAAGVAALDTLLPEVPPDEQPLLAGLQDSVVLAQAIELVRDHPEAASRLPNWCDLLAERSAYLDQRVVEPNIAEVLWQAALWAAAGVVLERDDLFQGAANTFRGAVDDEIHPEGYLPAAVDSGSAAANLSMQLQCVKALVLIAEMGRHAGVELWDYDNRGVSINTAMLYPLYYYFYPDQWRWVKEVFKGGHKIEAETLDEADAEAIFRANCGPLELINRHHGQRPQRAVRMILDDLRPIYDLYGGGLTTLTHALAERRGLFG
jgi:hypothetical protein